MRFPPAIIFTTLYEEICKQLLYYCSIEGTMEIARCFKDLVVYGNLEGLYIAILLVIRAINLFNRLPSMLVSPTRYSIYKNCVTIFVLKTRLGVSIREIVDLCIRTSVGLDRRIFNISRASPRIIAVLVSEILIRPISFRYLGASSKTYFYSRPKKHDLLLLVGIGFLPSSARSLKNSARKLYNGALP
ncbi:hypothetical protein F1880_010255 [Penicillium rolfsii]|nr:hypothetical protein F1880_010255 [Penicillium rolfsii]